MPARRNISGLSTAMAPAIVSMPQTEDIIDRGLREIRDSIERRAYDLCQRRGFYPGNDLDDWFRAESELLRFVPIEIVEDDDNVNVTAEVPGFSAKDLDIHVETNRLLLRGKTESYEQEDRGQLRYSERQGMQLFRAVNLPTEVDPQSARATLSDGVLQLTLPKASESKATRVQVRAA